MGNQYTSLSMEERAQIQALRASWGQVLPFAYPTYSTGSARPA